MKKLWQKKWNLNKAVEIFESKEDILLDNKLTIYDLAGTMAHAKMLYKISILSHSELKTIKKGLLEIKNLFEKGKFTLVFGEEDIHTKIENYLTKYFGEIGKKIHTGRSRNDQVLTAIRLFTKKEVLDIWRLTIDLTKGFYDFSKKYNSIAMPGYTHMQKAMPYSIGKWAENFAQAFCDDAQVLESAYHLIDQSPLGSAAAFGTPLNLDKIYTAKLLGFRKVQENDLYCQNSRGKFEAVDIAKKYKTDAIAHGCTGKGNDQVRFDGYILTHDPNMKILAPVREWDMDRTEEIHYAKKHGIPVPASVDVPYSDDDNMWGMTWEGGEIEEPHLIAPLEKFLTTYTLAKKAEDKEELVKLGFKKGIPVSLNGEKFTLAKLIVRLNKLAGKYGVGVTHMFEDRLVGVKNGGVYEQPAAHVIIEAHKALEKYVCTRNLNQLKAEMDVKWGYLCYGALWFDPSMLAINAFNDFINEKVTGSVTVKLYKGSTTVVAMKSPYGLDHTSFNKHGGTSFNVNASAGFIEIYSLQMRLANQIKKTKL